MRQRAQPARWPERWLRPAVLGASCLLSCSADEAHDPEPAPVDREALAADALVWGYPLVVTQRTLQSLGGLVGVNQLFNQTTLSDSTVRVIVAPNQDTLYSVAVVDLRSAPMVLTVPDVHDRYWTYQFLDAWTESFHYIGTRATQGRGGAFVITAPGTTSAVPAGAEEIRSPTPQLFLLGRYHARSPDDVASILALERSLVPLADPPPEPPPPLGTAPGPPPQVASDGAAFFNELGDALASNPPASDFDRQELARFAPLGIAAGAHPTETADAETLSLLEVGVARGLERITTAAAGNEPVNGWTTASGIGRYGNNVLVRARVARSGWGANIAEEAVYSISMRDADGAAYDGAKRYIMHFGPGQTPPIADALGFWSVTVYGPDMYFVQNSLERYVIGDRSPGLAYGADGSLDLHLQTDAPTGQEANWLPVPSGPFVLMMRVYLPGADARSGAYAIPGVRPVP